MAWSQLIVLIAFFVFPLVYDFVRKRAREQAERSSSTTELPPDFTRSNSAYEWELPEATAQTKTVYAPALAAIPSPQLPAQQLGVGRPSTSTSLPSPATIRATLRNRQGFRRAMVHKVVLGQPLALRRSD